MAPKISKKPNWGKCGFCDAAVTMRRERETKKVVTLNKSPVYIILDPKSPEVYWYNGSWVHGRIVADGLVAYRKHKCKCMR